MSGTDKHIDAMECKHPEGTWSSAGGAPGPSKMILKCTRCNREFIFEVKWGSTRIGYITFEIVKWYGPGQSLD